MKAFTIGIGTYLRINTLACIGDFASCLSYVPNVDMQESEYFGETLFGHVFSDHQPRYHVGGSVSWMLLGGLAFHTKYWVCFISSLTIMLYLRGKDAAYPHDGRNYVGIFAFNLSNLS